MVSAKLHRTNKGDEMIWQATNNRSETVQITLRMHETHLMSSTTPLSPYSSTTLHQQKLSKGSIQSAQCYNNSVLPSSHKGTSCHDDWDFTWCHGMQGELAAKYDCGVAVTVHYVKGEAQAHEMEWRASSNRSGPVEVTLSYKRAYTYNDHEMKVTVAPGKKYVPVLRVPLPSTRHRSPSSDEIICLRSIGYQWSFSWTTICIPHSEISVEQDGSTASTTASGATARAAAAVSGDLPEHQELQSVRSSTARAVSESQEALHEQSRCGMR